MKGGLVTSGTYDYGLWGLVAFHIGVFVLFGLGLLQPASRREWRSMGARVHGIRRRALHRDVRLPLTIAARRHRHFEVRESLRRLGRIAAGVEKGPDSAFGRAHSPDGTKRELLRESPVARGPCELHVEQCPEPDKQAVPIKGQSLYDFASTSGWNLGKEPEGAAYFNKLRIVELTAQQNALVVRIAKSSYRPYCDNSTFFQDCNHGSALLGLLQLGAAQGLGEDELYREALAFNSFWFPQNYIYNALYMKAVKAEEWGKVDAKVLMGSGFSSASGSARTQAEVAMIPNLIPKQKGEGESCSV